MSLSYEESMKKLLEKENNVATTKIKAAMPTVATMNIDEPIADMDSIMTLDETSMVAAYSGDDGSWMQHSGYETYSFFEDDDISTIDEKKDIKLSDKQINITQEENSQYIPFEMPRYYDGFDLVETNISIHYETSNKYHGVTQPINVTYNNEKIRFAWLVEAGATQVAGKLKFEIHADGAITDSQGNVKGYTWKSKFNENLNVLQSLCTPDNCDETIINKIDDETWVTTLVTKVAESVADKIANAQIGSQVTAAENAAIRAENAAASAEGIAAETVEEALTNYSTTSEMQDYVADAIENADIDGKLTEYAKTSEVETLVGDIGENENVVGYVDASIQEVNDNLTNNYYTSTQSDQKLTATLQDYATKQNVTDAIAEADISDKLNDYYTKEETYSKTEVDTKVANVKVDLTGYATEKFVTDKTDILSSDVSTNKGDIKTLSGKVGELDTAIKSIDTSPRLTYDVAYNDVENPDVGENVFVFYEITNEGQENEEKTPKQKFTIVGGGGGGATSSTLKIGYVTTSPLVVTTDDKALIKYTFSGTDSSGDAVTEGNAVWKVNGKVVATNTALGMSAANPTGENEFDITDYISVGSQKVNLTITDDAGSLASKNWTVQVVDVKIESDFNDQFTYPIGTVSFNYTPYGAISKDIHFILDGKEIGTVTTASSGIPMAYDIPAQEHGAHLLEVYMTAVINGNDIKSNRIVRDIIWYDDTSNVPVIGTVYQKFEARQYDTTNIEYTVYDPSTETPHVEIAVDGTVVSTLTLTENTAIYPFKTDVVGEHIITITCGETVKTLTANVTKLDINVAPVTAGLAFDFNPAGYTNNSADRLWSYNDVTMTVSDNFDWVNGGYQIDENGDQYFCVKAGTNAVINYNLFADDPKKTGKEFKVIFRTKNIRKRDTSFLTCIDENIGLDMKVEHATVYDSGGSLKSNYCEDAIIEYEFNINKDTDMMIVMSYEDGTPSKPYEYKETSSFKQSTAQPITIGSADCDIFIYRMKAYSISLSDTDIKNNFIADARNATEMIARYNRNDIYNDNNELVSTANDGSFNADDLMKAAPDLRYIFLEVPQFTNDKDNKIDGCNVYFRYPAGTRPHDNWDCTGVRHRGQGTSSNLYGYAGRNIDLCMDRDESLFTYTNEEGEIVESSTITLTDTSVPTDYLNIKVNIASSENANNAEMARRFNEYQPFLRYARKKDSKVKDTMEFYNCVVFIRETSTDPSVPHREFNDTKWHFYGIGNVGDSKKTDDTRVNNKRDPKECVVEITDADKPLSAFPTGKENHAICPVGEWEAGNTAYDILYSNEYVYDEEGEFESFGGKTYEFRYEMKNITEEQRQVNIDTWRELYTFIVTSSDEEFYANLKKYFVVDSALYFYLFTERYTMVDNRAKNSFWHYGKVYISNEEAATLGEVEASYYIIDDEQAAFADGYRWDLTFGYDFDTCLGIDNTGDYVFSYGKEDTDYYVDGDPTSDYVFRVADSVFFCRLRDLFPSELQAMFKNREEKNAWNSNSLIVQWDNSQALFPEELWRLDYQRKYYRTYLGLSIDNSINEGEGKGVDKTFLIGKFFGRKKYARRGFEINNEVFFATKYFGNKALSDVIWVRGNVPIGSNIKPNYSLILVPYSDMYVTVQYTSTGTPIHKKVKAGETVVFENNSERMDFIYIYAASFIQEIGDLSRCFVGDNNFASGTRLQRITLGSNDEGYENTFMKEVLVGNNPLLEYLDLRKISGINTVIDVSGCSNLKELYAEGTNASGVIFANGGLLETAHLPKLTSLSMKNLNYIKDFAVDGYDKLQTLIVENTPSIDTYNIVKNAPLLKLLRLIGLSWEAESADIFDRLLIVDGIDSSGYETDQSILTGTATVPVIGQYEHQRYQEAWSDLTIIPTTTIKQFVVTFVNEDGTVLDTQYVNQFENAVDPLTREKDPIAIPTKDSTTQYDYTFDGWDSALTNVVADRTITATYAESVRKYTVHYVSKGTVLNGDQEPVPYGSNVVYDGDIPTYTLEEPYAFYLFNRWDKSGFVDGDKTVNAIFDKFEYADGCFANRELADLSPVEIYALTKLGLDNVTHNIEDGDDYSFELGYDFNYDDIDSEVIISEKTVFNGTNHIDTGIKLFDEDRDFVLAIDYKMASENKLNNVLAQCYQSNGRNGFKLWYSSGVKFTWGTSADTPAFVGNREIVIIRHRKGENNLTIYNSNLDSLEISTVELTNSKSFTTDSTLVFGCAKADDGAYENHAIGEIHWAKIWYADLGEQACEKLAGWTHEKVTMEVCGAKKYYLTENPSKRCSFTLLATHLLERSRTYNLIDSNVGGWANSNLNKFLNNRLYKSMSDQMKLLVKQVTVVSSIGNKSSETSTSECYIAIPALIEVSNTNEEPYVSEGTTISYMTSSEERKRAYVDGDYAQYWLRSPNTYNAKYIWTIDANGDTQGYVNPSYNKHGVLIEISF